MRILSLLLQGALWIFLILLHLTAHAQVQVSGTIYDRSARFGMPGVSVRSTSGAGAVTDSLGNYSIRVPLADSLSFSYQGKSTQNFPVKEIPRGKAFNMSIHVDIHTLPLVEVAARARSYQLDSLENRREYRKIFDYDPELLSPGSSTGVGINLNMLFNAKKIRRMEAFRRFLEREERDKYVDYRFNKDLVKKIAGLDGAALDTFMYYYRPSYELLRSFENDYEFYEYIKEEGRYFYRIWRRHHPRRSYSSEFRR
jgi:hypothetical protein